MTEDRPRRPRGRPPGSKNKSTLEKERLERERMISETKDEIVEQVVKTMKDEGYRVVKDRGIRLKNHRGTFRVVKRQGEYVMLESEQYGNRAYNVILKGDRIVADKVDGMTDPRARLMFKSDARVRKESAERVLDMIQDCYDEMDRICDALADIEGTGLDDVYRDFVIAMEKVETVRDDLMDWISSGTVKSRKSKVRKMSAKVILDNGKATGNYDIEEDPFGDVLYREWYTYDGGEYELEFRFDRGVFDSTENLEDLPWNDVPIRISKCPDEDTEKSSKTSKRTGKSRLKLSRVRKGWTYDGEFVAEDDDALVDWAIDSVREGTEVGLYFKRVYDDERERFGDDHDYLCHFDMGGGTGFPSFGDWFRQCIDTIDMDLRWVEDDDMEKSAKSKKGSAKPARKGSPKKPASVPARKPSVIDMDIEDMIKAKRVGKDVTGVDPDPDEPIPTPEPPSVGSGEKPDTDPDMPIPDEEPPAVTPPGDEEGNDIEALESEEGPQLTVPPEMAELGIDLEDIDLEEESADEIEKMIEAKRKPLEIPTVGGTQPFANNYRTVSMGQGKDLPTKRI